MQTILNFLVKHNHWFLLLLLEGISFMLIVHFNNYQRAAFFTATNNTVGNIYSAISDIDSYFGLRTENNSLKEHNAELLSEISKLKATMVELKNHEALLTDTIVLSFGSGYTFHTANVVNNPLNSINNFIVLDKGTKDGIRQEMGVFCSKGVVGIVYLTSENYSLVLPLLNSKSSTSCRIIGDEGESVPLLQWDGSDIRYSYLVDLPRYTKFNKGDTVVTSGHSEIFPGGITVGTIEDVENSADGMFYRAKVKLSTNFATLASVFVVGNKGHEELKELMDKIPEK